MAKRSALWGFFNKTNCENKKVKCKLCEKKTYYKTSANLRSHLLTRHKEAYKDVSTEQEKTTEVTHDEDSMGSVDTTKHQRLWNYFEHEDCNEKVANCNFCDKAFSYHSTISNLKKHLKNRHREAFKKYLLVTKLIDLGMSPASKLNNSETTEALTVEKPASPEISITLDGDSNFSDKFCAEVWRHFVTHNSAAHCKICKSSLQNTIEDMKNHLEDAHPSILAYIIQNDTDSTDSESSQINEEDIVMFTEIECIEGTEITKHRDTGVKPFWRFFHKSLDGDKKAQCKLCGKELSYLSTTGNIKKHLRKKHREAYDELPTDYRKPASYKPMTALCIRKHLNRKLWHYFESINNNEKLAKCKLCRKTLSYQGTIANLKRHFKHKHPETFEKYLRNSKLCPKNIGGESGKAPAAVAPVVKFGAAAVVEPASPALAITQDDDSNSSKKFYVESEGQFIIQDSVALGTTCEKTVEDDEDMKSHLEDAHSSALTQDRNDSTDEEDNIMITECVYFEDIKTVNPSKQIEFSSDQTVTKQEVSNRMGVSKIRKPIQPRSAVWNFFKKCNGVNGQAQCNLCVNKRFYSTDTSNLKKHLQKHHKEAYKHMLEQKKATSKNKTLNAPTKIYRNGNLWKYFERDNDKEKIAKCNICLTMIAYKNSIGNLKKHLRVRHLLDSEPFGQRKKMPATAPAIKSEPAIAITQNNDLSKKLAEVWRQLETEECTAYCTFCRKTTKNTIEDMKSHLEKAHPYKLSDITLNKDANDSVNDSASLQKNEEDDSITTEAVHVKDEIRNTLEQSKSSSDPTEDKKSSVPGATKQEISTFLNYVGVLLNKVSSKSLGKLQVNIINMVMNATESEH